MSAENVLQRQKNKLAVMETIKSAQLTWKERFESIPDMNQAAFCDEYDINKFWFNRLIHMKQLASENIFNKVESALKSEGV